MSDRGKLPPQTVRIEDAQVHLSDLLSCATRGESFEVTEGGQAVARIVPPTHALRRAQAEVDRAIERLKGLEGMFGDATVDDVIAWKNEGRE